MEVGHQAHPPFVLARPAFQDEDLLLHVVLGVLRDPQDLDPIGRGYVRVGEFGEEVPSQVGEREIAVRGEDALRQELQIFVQLKNFQ